jgi:hypothetical protein
MTETVTVARDSADKPSGKEAREDALAENKMRDYYASQPKVSIKTREDEWVQVNGYTFIIKAGERVDVPKDIADILEESGRI